MPAGKRYNPYENLLGPDNVAALNTLWSFATGNAVSSSPAVANGVLYVGSDDNNIYAVSANGAPPQPARAIAVATASRPESGPGALD
jgi:hypothetical protein